MKPIQLAILEESSSACESSSISASEISAPLSWRGFANADESSTVDRHHSRDTSTLVGEPTPTEDRNFENQIPEPTRTNQTGCSLRPLQTHPNEHVDNPAEHGQMEVPDEATIVKAKMNDPVPKERAGNRVSNTLRRVWSKVKIDRN